ncbi:MAG: nuclear transport factor 2 family protein [Steroidobacteraceae bacterium]
MSSTREVAQRYMDLLCAGRYADAFGMLSVDATYKIVGSSPTMRGRDTIIPTLLQSLASFGQPLRVTLREIIVEGNKAVALASGAGAGPTGKPYKQEYYAMVLSIEAGAITSVIEFMDTVEVETKLLDKKLVAS